MTLAIFLKLPLRVDASCHDSIAADGIGEM
jgi:hypothetical protein